ncbi:uncharacterized protein LOC135831643 [Planococcus citri]|uniref:uncharacterized protein LOC135831643 n=1 Tax=Planococcus citri TaxID=170843 RepID=UPI0031F87071
MYDNEGMSSDDEAAGRATIRVSVGEVNLIAILDKQCALNAIHKKILNKICEQDRCKKTFDDGVDIELDIIIDGRPVKTSFHVVGGLYADMILGKKFFVETQAHVYLELKLLEWSSKKTTITTNLLQNNYSRAASKAREKWEKTTDEAKEKLVDVFEKFGFTAPAPRKEDSDEEENEEKTATKTSKEKKNSSKNKKKFVKFFIVQKVKWDKSKGKCSAYYGVSSPQKNVSFVTGEKLNPKEKSAEGYYLEALRYAFETADQKDIDYLHVVGEVQNSYAIELMKNYRSELDGGQMFHQAQPIGLDACGDLGNYYNACFGVAKFEYVKFECVSDDDETYGEMIHLRKLVDDFMNRNPK